jgi:hypothetical protein
LWYSKVQFPISLPFGMRSFVNASPPCSRARCDAKLPEASVRPELRDHLGVKLRVAALSLVLAHTSEPFTRRPRALRASVGPAPAGVKENGAARAAPVPLAALDWACAQGKRLGRSCPP